MSSPVSQNSIHLSAPNDGSLTKVNLYIGLAEVARTFNVELQEGDNHILISELPTVLVDESLRIEGEGTCTIHEVSVSTTPLPEKAVTSSVKQALLKEKDRTQKALLRCRRAVEAVDCLYNTLDAKHIGPSTLQAFNDQALAIGNTLDEKAIRLEEQLLALDEEITKEEQKLGTNQTGNQLSKQVSITVNATQAGHVHLTIIYGVSRATWSAAYDVYVRMDKDDKPVNLIYKAAITQSTGEDWKDIALSLETSQPTFGHSIPDLVPWTLSTRKLYELKVKSKKLKGGFSSLAKTKKEQRKSSNAFLDIFEDDESESEGGAGTGLGVSAMRKRQVQVTSKGNVTATFAIPGFITVPTDNNPHNVTIQQLALDAEMSWMAVPKSEAKAHLMAKIPNDSEYTLLDGPSSVYVDGSFISRSRIPNVSPQESFDCPLGIDPTIRITYHAVSKKAARTSTFTRKLITTEFQQRITIHNTKPSTGVKIKVLDQVPVSENSDIVVDLTSPKLSLAQPNKKGQLTAPEAVRITNSITGRWDGSEDEDVDPSIIGKDGALCWDCSLAPQEKITLLLAWDVTCSPTTTISGM